MAIPTNAVKAVIRNKQQAILIVQRSKSLRDDDSWDLPGGLIEKGEIPEQALKREIKEELGLDVGVAEREGHWQFKRKLDDKMISVTNYSCEASGDIELSEEHQAIGGLPMMSFMHTR